MAGEGHTNHPRLALATTVLLHSLGDWPGGGVSGQAAPPSQPLSLDADAVTFSSTLSVVDYLFDGNESTHWQTGDLDGAAAWVMISLGGGATVTEYRIQNRLSDANSNWQWDSPLRVTLQASNDGASWTDLHSAGGLEWSSASQWQTFAVPQVSTSSYWLYRVYFAETGKRPAGQQFVVLAEALLVGYTCTVYQFLQSSMACDVRPVLAPTNGQLGCVCGGPRSSKIPDGTTCDLTCNAGYMLAGQPTCNAGVLSSTTARYCNALGCTATCTACTSQYGCAADYPACAADQPSKLACAAPVPGYYLHGTDFEIPSACTVQMVHAPASYPSDAYSLFHTGECSNWQDIRIASFAADNPATNSVDKCASECARTILGDIVHSLVHRNGCVSFRLSDSNECALYNGVCIGVNGSGSVYNLVADVRNCACSSQEGCLDDGVSCSTVPGLETKLVCEPGGGAAGYYVDGDGTATACPDGTMSAAVEASTAGCEGVCAMQIGCVANAPACAADQPSKLACAAPVPGYYLHGTDFEITSACTVQLAHATSSYPSDAYSLFHTGECLNSADIAIGRVASFAADNGPKCASECARTSGCVGFRFLYSNECRLTITSFAADNPATNSVDKCASECARTSACVSFRLSDSNECALYNGVCIGVNGSGSVYNLVADVRNCACSSQEGCLNDTVSCSTVPGLETKLVCEPGGGAAGYYVDGDGTATACPDGTMSTAGEVSTRNCSIVCTSQEGCLTDSSTCSTAAGLETKLACEPAGGAAGHYVDADSIVRLCPVGTMSSAGEVSTTGCGNICTIQTGCATSNTAVCMDSSKLACTAAAPGFYLHGTNFEIASACTTEMVHAPSSYPSDAYALEHSGGCSNWEDIMFASFATDNEATNSVDKCASECARTSGCVGFRLSDSNECALYSGACVANDGATGNVYNLVADVRNCACSSQEGCLDDGVSCSTVPGLETKLVCEPGGGAAGYYVDGDGTATACPDGTMSTAGEVSTRNCSIVCTSQEGCETDTTECTSSSAWCTQDNVDAMAGSIVGIVDSGWQFTIDFDQTIPTLTASIPSTTTEYSLGYLRSYDFKTGVATFEGGDGNCNGGAGRAAYVTLVYGESNSIQTVVESRECFYELTVQTPGCRNLGVELGCGMPDADYHLFGSNGDIATPCTPQVNVSLVEYPGYSLAMTVGDVYSTLEAAQAACSGLDYCSGITSVRSNEDVDESLGWQLRGSSLFLAPTGLHSSWVKVKYGCEADAAVCSTSAPTKLACNVSLEGSYRHHLHGTNFEIASACTTEMVHTPSSYPSDAYALEHSGGCSNWEDIMFASFATDNEATNSVDKCASECARTSGCVGFRLSDSNECALYNGACVANDGATGNVYNLVADVRNCACSSQEGCLDDGDVCFGVAEHARKLQCLAPQAGYVLQGANNDTSTACTRQTGCADVFHYSSTPRAYADAVTYCESVGMRLASIHSRIENNMAYGMMHEDAWIGLVVDESTPAGWAWVDGSPYDFEDYTFAEHSDSAQDGDAVSYDISGNDISGHWRPDSMGNQRHVLCRNFIEPSCSVDFPTQLTCQTPAPGYHLTGISDQIASACTPQTGCGGLPGGAWAATARSIRLEDGKLAADLYNFSTGYWVTATTEFSVGDEFANKEGTFRLSGSTSIHVSGILRNWDDSVAYCESIGMQVASIRTVEEERYVRSILNTSCYVGARPDGNGQWTWTDGTGTVVLDGGPNVDPDTVPVREGYGDQKFLLSHQQAGGASGMYNGIKLVVQHSTSDPWGLAHRSVVTSHKSGRHKGVVCRRIDRCSTVAGLEQKLVCPAGGNADGYYVDSHGTPTPCATGTYSHAGESSTMSCDACTSQAGCISSGASCSTVVGLETKLVCQVESCAAAADCSFTAGDPASCGPGCTYTGDTPGPESCTADAADACSGWLSDGTATPCNDAGNCVYTPAGGAAGYFVDAQGTAVACPRGTFNAAGAGGQNAAVACVPCTAAQTGCLQPKDAVAYSYSFGLCGTKSCQLGHEAVPDENECTNAAAALGVASPRQISRIDKPSGCYQDADGSVWFNSWERGYADPSEVGRCPICRRPPSRGTAKSLQLDPAKVTCSPTWGSTPALDQVEALLIGSSSATVWHSDGLLPAWLIMEVGRLEEGVVVTEFTIRNREGSLYATDSPLSLSLQGSNDYATWTDLRHASGIVWSAAFESKTFTVDSRSSYRYYRLQFTETGSRNYVVLSRLEIKGHAPLHSDSWGHVQCTDYGGTPNENLKRGLGLLETLQDPKPYCRQLPTRTACCNSQEAGDTCVPAAEGETFAPPDCNFTTGNASSCGPGCTYINSVPGPEDCVASASPDFGVCAPLSEIGAGQAGTCPADAGIACCPASCDRCFPSTWADGSSLATECQSDNAVYTCGIDVASVAPCTMPTLAARGSGCSIVPGLEMKLQCKPGGGANGFFVDHFGTATPCGPGTYSFAGENSTTGCDPCTSQTGCVYDDEMACLTLIGLETKLKCDPAGAAPGYYVNSEGIAQLCPTGTLSLNPLSCFGNPLTGEAANICNGAYNQGQLHTDSVLECAAWCLADPACIKFAFATGSDEPNCRLSATCTVPTDFAPGWDGYMRSNLCLAADEAAMYTQTPDVTCSTLQQPQNTLGATLAVAVATCNSDAACSGVVQAVNDDSGDTFFAACNGSISTTLETAVGSVSYMKPGFTGDTCSPCVSQSGCDIDGSSCLGPSFPEIANRLACDVPASGYYLSGANSNIVTPCTSQGGCLSNATHCLTVGPLLPTASERSARCIAAIPDSTLMVKPSNPSFQTTAWNVGCGFGRQSLSVDDCRAMCSTGPGCCGGNGCAGNSCSGGGCCAASRTICEQACQMFYDLLGSRIKLACLPGGAATGYYVNGHGVAMPCATGSYSAAAETTGCAACTAQTGCATDSLECVTESECIEPQTEAECAAAAETAGLALGGGGHAFAGAYESEGCYSHSSGDFAGMAYWSTGTGDLSTPQFRVCMDFSSKLACAAAAPGFYLHGTNFEIASACTTEMVHAPSSYPSDAYALEYSGGCSNWEDIMFASFATDNEATNSVDKCASECARTSGCVGFRLSDSNECALYNGACVANDGTTGNVYNLVADVRNCACSSQEGCLDDSVSCSTVPGLETKLVCEPGGGAAGYYVDGDGTAARCTRGTRSKAGDSACIACTGQPGCSVDDAVCSSEHDLYNDGKLVCTSGDQCPRQSPTRCVAHDSVCLVTHMWGHDGSCATPGGAMRIALYSADNEGTNTVDKCAEQCATTSGCGHFNFGVGARAGECRLYYATHACEPNVNAAWVYTGWSLCSSALKLPVATS